MASAQSACEFCKFTKGNGVNHTLIAPYHSRSDGQADGVVQAFKQLLKATRGNSIKQSFARFLFGYSTTSDSTTVQTPCVLFLNPRFKTRLDSVCPDLGGKVFDKQSYQKFRMDKGRKEREHSVNESGSKLSRRTKMVCLHHYRANRPCLLKISSRRSILEAPRSSNASNTGTSDTILQW